MKINTKILKGLNQATSGSVSFSDAKGLFEKGIQRILNKNEYLKFIEFLKTLVGQKITVYSFGKWGFYQPEISDKVKSINPPEGIVDWQIEFENGIGLLEFAVHSECAGAIGEFVEERVGKRNR